MAQEYFVLSPSNYTDVPTGINFTTWATPGLNGTGAFSFGFVLPEDALKKDATEYIGRLVRFFVFVFMGCEQI